MNILLDACVWGCARSQLEAAGHDAVWAGDWPEDPGDDEIMSPALGEGRVLVTLDKDFGELAIVRGLPHGGIIRLVGLAARRQGEVCLHLLSHHADELQAGAILTADAWRVRARSK